MKNLILLLLFSMFATGASAQFLLGGQFNFSSTSDKEEGGDDDEFTTSVIVLMPRLAYVSGKTWYGVDAGVTLLNDKSRFNGGNEVESKTTLASVAPFVRYVYQPTDNLGIWIEGQAGVLFGSDKDDSGDKTAEYSGFNIGARPGVIFFIGNHFSFEASFGRLGFNSLVSKNPNDSKDKETVSQFGLSLNNNSLFDEITGFSSGFQFGVNYKF